MVMKLLLCSFLLLPLAIATYRLFFHPLAGIPGPILAKVTGLWRTYLYFRMTWHEDILKLHNKYGRVVRIAPDEISVVDAAAAKALYGHARPALKTDWYKTWTRSDPTQMPVMFAETNKKVHAALRKRVSAVYSMSAILKFETYIQDCLDILFTILKKKVAKTGSVVVDMAEWTNALAFDIVGELSYGERLGHMEAGKDVDDVRKTIAADTYLTGNVGHFWLQTKLYQNAVADTIASIVGMEAPIVRFMDWSIAKITARKEQPSDRQDMLSHFLKMKSLDGHGPASDAEILVEAVNIVGAGADTTSIGMRSCLYYVAMNPEVYHRLRHDVDDFYQNNQLTRPITHVETQQIPYLKAVVSEATRLLPSIVYQLLRSVPEGGMIVDGRFIPAGTAIGVSAIAQNRDKSIWGEDANEFRPERWMENPAKLSLFESSSMTYGGSGPRACIGRNIALVELHKFLAQLLRQFDFEIVNKERPWKIESFWFANQSEFFMRLTERQVQDIHSL